MPGKFGSLRTRCVPFVWTKLRHDGVKWRREYPVLNSTARILAEAPALSPIWEWTFMLKVYLRYATLV